MPLVSLVSGQQYIDVCLGCLLSCDVRKYSIQSASRHIFMHEGMRGYTCTNSIQSASLHILKCSQEVYVQQTGGMYEQLCSTPMPCTLCG